MIITFFSCGEKKAVIKVENYQNHNHEIINPKIIISNSKSKLIQSRSKFLFKDADDHATLYGNVTTHFFNDSSDYVSFLTSDTVKIDEKNNNFNAIGNVVVKSDSGFVLKTEKIIWDHEYKLIISNDSVEFTTLDGDTLYGLGFESDMDLTQWKILKPSGVTNRLTKFNEF